MLKTSSPEIELGGRVTHCPVDQRLKAYAVGVTKSGTVYFPFFESLSTQIRSPFLTFMGL